MRYFKILILLLFTTSLNFTHAQNNEMFKQKRERKKVWRKWRSKNEAYNPYLKKKAKDKPSARMAKGDRKELRRQKRQARKQMKRNKRAVNS